MNKQQYNEMINWTIKQEQLEDKRNTLEAARLIFKNMGIPLPSGTMEEAAKILATNDYMGWRKCTAKEAQTCANDGTAAMAVKGNEIYIVKAESDGKDEVATAHCADDTASTLAEQEDAQFYSYSAATTTIVPKPQINLNAYEMNVEVMWTGKLTVSFDDPNETDETIIWQSNQPNIVSVNASTGDIVARKVGRAIVTAYTNDGRFAKCIFDVKKRVCYKDKKEKLVWFQGDEDLGFVGIKGVTCDVQLNLLYNIIEWNGTLCKIEDISVFAYTDTDELNGFVEPPDLTIGPLYLNGVEIPTTPDQNCLVSPSWLWDCRTACYNKWVTVGSKFKAMVGCMQDSLVYPRREVKLEVIV